MTTLREAAQQALEALEILLQTPTARRQAWDASAALRAALAEQCQCGDRPAAECPGEWEPGCDLGANDAHVKVHEPQEPAAWRIVDGEGDYAYRSEPPDNFCLLHAKRYGRQYEALYTHPAPQRQPLPKHDQHCVDVPGYGLMATKLVRAVERAHGIGGQDE